MVVVASAPGIAAMVIRVARIARNAGLDPFVAPKRPRILAKLPDSWRAGPCNAKMKPLPDAIAANQVLTAGAHVRAIRHNAQISSAVRIQQREPIVEPAQRVSTVTETDSVKLNRVIS